ncbi:MAG TPA: HEAT repeat domain-containing protein [Candidatus Gallacutalibacter stercoravium]|nr:HEAT repeat domain-containing protein [Candidatus Gallacutalibacter stercoravium]
MSKLHKIEKCIEKGKEQELMKLAYHRNKEVRLAAIDGMGKIGKDDSFNQLITMLQNRDADIRKAAAQALGTLKNDHASPHLHYLLDREKDETVKEAIVSALDELHRGGDQ